MNQLEQQILNYFRANVQAVIQQFDFNRDGSVFLQEITKVVQLHCYNANTATQIANAIFDQLDLDRNGYITLQDFQTCM